MSIHDLSHDALAAKARQVFTNTTADPDMMTAVADRGYDQPNFDAALANLVTYEARIRAQIDRAGLAEDATQTLEQDRHAFHRDVYMDHVERARRAFKDEPGTLRRPGLRGDRERAFSAWIGQTRQLYQTALGDPDLQARLAPRGQTAAVLQAAADQVAALVRLDEKQEDATGLAQQATRDRDAARTPVLNWLAAYYEAAERAVAEHPDWLERIRKVAPSG